MKRWGRWSKLTFMGALLAEFFLPSPSAIGARWGARWDLVPSGASLSAAIAAQDVYTPDLLGIDGVVGTAVGFGADGAPAVLVYAARPGVLGLPAMLDGIPVRIEVTGEFWALGDGPRASEADARRSVSCCEYSSYEIDWLDSRHLIPADWIRREFSGVSRAPS